jgi:hypothetical protein
MAWIETTRAPAAPVHEAVRLMHAAGALTWMVCHLAEWLVQQGRASDGARLLGWAERRFAERGEEPSEHGKAAQGRAVAALETMATAAELRAWRQQGEGWHDDEVAAALLAS